MRRLRIIQLLPLALILAAFFLFVAPAAEFFESWDCGGLDGEMIYISAIVVLAGLLLIRGILASPILQAVRAIPLISCRHISCAPTEIHTTLFHRFPAILRI
jgi:hypothetical protein